GSSLVGADSSADNVFFITSDQLVLPDTDQSPDMYDARVGGVAAPAPPGPPVPACAAALDGSCQGPGSAPPVLTAPQTAAGSNVNTVTIIPTRVKASIKATSAKSRKQLARTATVRLSVKVSGPTTLTLTATGRIGKKSKTLGHVTKTVKRAGTVTLQFK